VLLVEPRREELDDPAPLGTGRRVEAQQGLAELLGVGRAQPAEQEADLALEEVGGLVEHQLVVRPALVLLLVAEVGHGAELDLQRLAVVALGAPDVLLAVVAVAVADAVGEAVEDAGQLGADAAQHHRLLVAW
jgi:hypothetical protein